MRTTVLIASFLFLACADEPVPVYVAPGGYECNFPEAYTATYDKLNGECGTFETESFPSELESSWFPRALNLDDCEQTVECTNGVIHGSSFCERATAFAWGTLDGELTFDTRTGSGTLELEISAMNYHRSSTCNSTYQVTYSK